MIFAFGPLTVELPSPVFTDTESPNIARSASETRGKKQVIFRDPSWPSTRMMTWKFTNLTLEEYNAINEFIDDTLGQEITVFDYKGRTFVGLITNPQAERVEHYGYSLEIDFEGDISVPT